MSAFGTLGYLSAAVLAVVPLFIKGEAVDRTSRSLLLVSFEAQQHWYSGLGVLSICGLDCVKSPPFSE